MSIKQKLQFSRQKLEFAYSIFIIIVPALLIFNSLWLLSNAKNDMDSELRRKANLVNSTLEPVVANHISDALYLQALVDEIKLDNQEIVELKILIPVENEFEVIAASNKKLISSRFVDVQSSVVWSKSQSVATLTNSESNKENERLWKVLTPVVSAGKKVAIIDSSVSTKDIDLLTASTFRQSLIILAVTVLATLLIFVNHFRFVEYAMLFKKLKELDQMKSDFLSIATHELKSPMAVISGYIDMVLEQKETKINEVAEKYLKKALDQTNRLSILVADLLNVSRIEQGRIKYDYSEVKINQIIDNIIGLYIEKAKDKGLELKYKKKDLPSVWADAGRIQEIFTNLIDNAIKYSESGTITVSHEIQSEKVITTVADQGLGMSSESQKKLFTRFYRVKTDKTAQISGTGLGLWIIKQYIENMGGRVEVESKEGEGTKFIITFSKHN